jgi:hypothetical protein
MEVRGTKKTVTRYTAGYDLCRFRISDGKGGAPHGDDFRTFVGHFMAPLLQSGFSTELSHSLWRSKELVEFSDNLELSVQQ